MTPVLRSITQKNMLEEKTSKNAPMLLMVQRLNSSFEAQKKAVEDAQSESLTLHENLQLKQRQHDALRETIAHDSSCIKGLRNVQEQVQHAEAAYKATRSAYAESSSVGLLQAAWGAKDSLDALNMTFYKLQKDCAREGFDIPDSAEPPPVCAKSTDGTCGYLWCDRSRNAYCDRATSSCLCSSENCATSTGQCKPRGTPFAATLEEPVVPEQAETPASGGLKICVVVFAVLVGMAAATVQKRSGSRNVMLSERLVE